MVADEMGHLGDAAGVLHRRVVVLSPQLTKPQRQVLAFHQHRQVFTAEFRAGEHRHRRISGFAGIQQRFNRVGDLLFGGVGVFRSRAPPSPDCGLARGLWQPRQDRQTPGSSAT